MPLDEHSDWRWSQNQIFQVSGVLYYNQYLKNGVFGNTTRVAGVEGPTITKGTYQQWTVYEVPFSNSYVCHKIIMILETIQIKVISCT